MRPLADFCGIELDYDPQSAPPVLCEKCRTEGPSKVAEQDVMAGIHLKERRLIAGLMEGLSVTKAAEAADMPTSRAHKLIRGEAKPIVRAAYQRILEEAGLTLPKIAKVMAEAIDAEKVMWNPEERQFDSFPDHNVRLKAASTAASHLDVAEPESKRNPNATQALSVTIITNLDGAEPKSMEDAFVARARVVNPNDGA